MRSFNGQSLVRYHGNAASNFCSFQSQIEAGSACVKYKWREKMQVSMCSVHFLGLDQSTRYLPNTSRRNAIWNLQIQRLVKEAKYSKALEYFSSMQQEGSDISSHSYVSILKACNALAENKEGRHIHASIIIDRSLPDILLENCLMDFYAKTGSIEDVGKLFNDMLARDVVSWTTVLVAYARSGQGEKALRLYEQMQREKVEPNYITFLSLLNSCANTSAIYDGRHFHAQTIIRKPKSNAAIESCLLDMYSKCGIIEEACQVFNCMEECNVVSWSTMISGYVRCGQSEKALILFQQMEREQLEPNSRTFVAALNACASSTSLRYGKHIHEQISRKGLESNVIVGSSLIDMYSKCGCMEDAHRVFDSMVTWNVVSWSTMIIGYGKNGQLERALSLYQQMRHAKIEPNRVTFIGILNACANLGALNDGRKVHLDVFQSRFSTDITVGNSLIDMYVKNGCLTDALRVFENLQARNVISWTSMIVGLVKLGEEQMALDLFERMRIDQIEPNIATFCAVVTACARLAALDEGRCIHADIIRNQMDSDVIVRSCLVFMYAKCGSIEDARRIFNEKRLYDSVVWNSMIAGHAAHGLGKDALWLFDQMCALGVELDSVTFTGILSACSHAGLLNEGQYWLYCMLPIYGIPIKLEHYGCVVDLLGRLGHVKEARDLIMSMQSQPDVSVWRALLGACRIHGELNIGKDAAYHVLELDPKNVSAYVLLSNIFVAQKWDDYLLSTF